MLYAEIFDSGDSTNPHVGVSRFAYKPAAVVNLEGAMNGAMTSAMERVAAAVGNTNPKFSSSVTTIDGFPARLATYSWRRGGTSVQIDAAFILNDQRLWQVLVFHEGEASVSDSKRIIDSIHIKAVQ